MSNLETKTKSLRVEKQNKYEYSMTKIGFMYGFILSFLTCTIILFSFSKLRLKKVYVNYKSMQILK